MSTPAKLSYRVVEGWEKLPAGFHHRDVAGVSLDAQDRVYILTRDEPRVIVYEPDGTYRASFGEGLFTNRTHGLTVGPDGFIYCADDGDHTVRKFSPAGELLMTLGTPGVASDTGYDGKTIASIKRGGEPFNRPTNVAISAEGDIFVSDGYGNARVHRFSPTGKLLLSWGEPGRGPGQFHLPHSLRIAPDGRVLVADRENDRIQFFSPTGEYLGQWTNVQRPTDLFVSKEGLVYVSELAWREGQFSFAQGEIKQTQYGRVSVLDLQTGEVLARWGGADIAAPGNFCAPHCVAVDSRGDAYVGEVTYTFGVKTGFAPADCHTFQKFARQ